MSCELINCDGARLFGTCLETKTLIMMNFSNLDRLERGEHDIFD